MAILLSVLLLLLGFIKPKSKKISYLIVLLMWILYGFNTYNVDFNIYNNIFNYTKAGHTYMQFGYSYLNEIAHYLDWSFIFFKVVITLLAFVLLYKSILVYTSNIAFVLALYMIFPFLLDVVQLKTFLSMTIVIYSLRYLINTDRKSVIKYIGLILIASSVHYLSLFYLFLLLVHFNKTKLLIKNVAIITILFILFSYSGFIKYILAFVLPIAKVNYWFEPKTGLGIVIVVALHSYITFLVHYVHYKFYNQLKIDRYKLIFSGLVVKINVIMWLIFPLYIFNMVFFRIYRNLFILFFILFGMFIYDKLFSKKDRFIFSLLLLLFVSALSIFYIFSIHFDDIFKAVMFNNLIF